MLPGLGGSELILILAIALIIFGPNKLPEMGRSLGKTIREFKNSTRGMSDDILTELQEVKVEVQDVNSRVIGR